MLWRLQIFTTISVIHYSVKHTDSELMTSLKLKMNDSKELAKISFGPDGTFSGFKFNEPVTRRIDYIMVSKSKGLEIEKYGVLSSSINLRYPSDHFPVLVDLRF